MRILLLGSLVAYPDPLKSLRDGYVYMVNGRVEAVGKQPVPPEHQDADAVMGGRGRIILPARTAALIHASLYPFRHLVGGRDPYAWEQTRLLAEEMECEEAWAAALLGLYEALQSGVGHAVLEDIRAGCVLKAVDELGMHAVAAVPAGCLEDHDWRGELGADERIGVAICKPGEDPPPGRPLYGHGLSVENAAAVFYASSITEGLHVVTPGHSSRRESFALGIGSWHRYDLLAAALSLQGIGYSPQSLVMAMHASGLVPGRMDAVMVVRIDRPPGWIAGGSWGASSYLALGPVETLVIGDNIVIDGGENLMVGEERLEEASEILEVFLDKIHG